jgi:hypothetical protein
MICFALDITVFWLGHGQGGAIDTAGSRQIKRISIENLAVDSNSVVLLAPGTKCQVFLMLPFL